MNKVNIKFAKIVDSAIIPSKRRGDGAYDIYACFEEDMIIIPPYATVMIPTGIASAFSEDYVMILKERGSTGVRGLGQRSGVIDSNYRGEWVAPITNHNDYAVVITDLEEGEALRKMPYVNVSAPSKSCTETTYYADSKMTQLMGEVIQYPNDNVTTYNFIIYPKSKAICQALLLPVPDSIVEEISYDELIKIESERGCGMLGSSGK